MEAVLAISIGVLFGSGVWLVLRPRTFQVITGLLLLSYAVNMFIFVMGKVAVDKAPITLAEGIDPALYADPLPQALVLTAIVIGFASTALYLVVLLASRGLTGTDHVDGKDAADGRKNSADGQKNSADGKRIALMDKRKPIDD
jgi:multicomponent K+:H+ antiporter subunit C